MSFTHLHLHSHFSILQALGKPEDYVEAAAQMGYRSLALTDNGVVYGLVDFYKACKKKGIRPILGMEAYIAPQGRFVKTAENRFASLVLLAENNEGYQNILKLSTKAALEGFYYKPRIDDEILKEHARGLIAISGGLSGTIPRAILEQDLPRARSLIAFYQEIFGKDHFYLEIQAHPEIANWTIVNRALMELSEETGAPLVATQDVHYIRPEDAPAHDLLLCLQQQKTVLDAARIQLLGDYSLKSEKSMTELFAHLPEALLNSDRIAERCEVNIEFYDNKMPNFDTGKVPSLEFLRTLCLEGLERRYGSPAPTAAMERLEFELSMIESMGFATYFLIVHDFVNYAKNHGILVGPGRGSAAGSIIAYVLSITDLDPLKYGLLFERFLNPERVSMPDIDIDFADSRRDEVLSYVTEKYGEDHVAQIITFGTMAPKAAIRDTGRCLGYPYGEVDAIAKTVPDAILGKYAPLTESIVEDPELSRLYKNDERARAVLDMAKVLEGTVRQTGTHACAVIISRDTLTDHTALQRAAGGKEGIVTQYSMKPCEELGLLKMDFLGLSNLSVMETTLEILKRTRPELTLHLNALPMDDEQTYQLLQRGETTGVFQLESGGMKRYLKDLKPTEFGDIIAMVSLYRPGPMQFISDYIDGKHGRKNIQYLHPTLEAILKETYGIAIYQEQILEMAKVFSGFSLGEADLLRRAIGKKIASELMAQRQKFIEGAVKMGHTETLACKIFDEVIEPFAGYGFNKSHAACYAMIAYQTAYLKAHFPAEFMAALLTSDADNTDRVVVEIEECRAMGIQVLPPDVNESRAHFTVMDEKRIRFGLMAIKGLGENAARELIRIREEGGRFDSLESLASRAPTKLLNKKTVESLAFSGAMDALGDRAQIAANTDAISAYSKQSNHHRESQQIDIFSQMDEGNPLPPLSLKPVPSLSIGERLRLEHQFLGLYVSGHPLQGLSRYLRGKGKLLRDLTPEHLKKKIMVTVLVTVAKRVMTKTGNYMMTGEIEDGSAKISFVAFPKIYAKISGDLRESALIRAEGFLEERGSELQFVLNGASSVSLDAMIQAARQNQIFDENELIVGVGRLEWNQDEGPKVLEIPQQTSTETLTQLKTLLEAHPGDRKIVLRMKSGEREKKVTVPFGVNFDAELGAAVARLLKS